ncbi:MAG: DEAD/DEAH box helicase, partial [Selenomonadaceae bacterium]|nr:DEAD/DEAH box helicase [Selenomonadaceae bacterium]
RKVGSKSVAMSAVARAAKLQRLKSTPIDGNACTVLHNVRCLSEGVDVPALDAIIFLASKRSEVEIVQAVGRVMRNAPHKKFGYIIIPVVVPLSKSAEDALDRNAEFKDVWRIINALRTHDHALTIEVERLRSTGETEKIIVTPGESADNRDDADKSVQLSLLNFLRWDDFKDKIYARMVEHVGDKLYWISWAYKVADIVERHTRRITELVGAEGVHKRAFDEFLDGLRRNLNPAVTAAEAVDMLAQHLITRPVFEGLFENYSFAANNPVSQAMQKILDALEGDGLTKDREIFARLYKQVRDECSNMGDAASRQRIITRLYESFFSFALKKTADKLGIVYTPVEVVDFILRSVDAVLRKYFNRGLTDENVHVLDPFAGTGTFIVRLIQSELIRAEDLPRKYRRELHANEIVLLAYYIAAINIENAFAACDKTYRPFDGICFTDTFQLYERGQQSLAIGGVLKVNSERVNSQQAAPIEVIVGNPPYSVGQRSANDNAQNQKYDNLERRIAATYAKGTDATLKAKIYDSYVKAFRWASDRLADGGIIGFVTNAGWLDNDSMDGLRKCFVNEFSAIYVFNLRGNARTQGELRQRESGNVFGSGSRAPIAVTILVKHSAHVGDAEIFYRDIGDYLTREQKLDIINCTPNVLHESFQPLKPNERGDWINQRGDLFYTFPILGDKNSDNKQVFFNHYSGGILTARDTWCYNFSRADLERNMQTTIDYYNSHEPTDVDATKIVWTRATRQNKNRGREINFNAAQIVESMYRPFCKQYCYYDRAFNEMTYQMPKFFPNGDDDNLLICMSGIGNSKNFSVLIVDKIPCFDMVEKSQCFPLYWYERSAQASLFGDEYQRRDGVTDFILRRARELYGDVTREDVFYYVYGFLHLPSYRERFANELKKSLPRIILVADAEKFWQLSRAGRQLADIHLNYESQPFADVEVIGTEHGDFRVDKLRFAKDDRTTLIYNRHIKIRNIPPRAFDYVVNGRSPLEWIIDRYRVKTDKASGIVNDANAWGIEHGNPRYILNLILSSITVSLRTLDIVDNLPSVEFGT